MSKFQDWINNVPLDEARGLLEEARQKATFYTNQVGFLSQILTIHGNPEPVKSEPSCLGDPERFRPTDGCEPCAYLDECAKAVASVIASAPQDDS